MLAPTAALAESEGRREGEVLLGTLQTRDTSNSPEGREADRGKAAGRMLSDAMAAIDSGDVMLGRRRLEVLVERYPDTLAGATARLELGQLYSGRPTYGGYTTSQGERLPPTRGELTGSRAQGYRDGLSAVGLRGAAAPATARDPVWGRRQEALEDRRLQALTRDFQSIAGDRVFFGDGDSELGARARAVLAAQARWLSVHGDLEIEIEAHADDRGSAKFNLDIAEQRGNNVRDRLIAEGLAAERITVRVSGSEEPVATCSAPECAAQNRRVVTHVRGIAPEADAKREAAGSASASVTVNGGASFGSRD